MLEIPIRYAYLNIFYDNVLQINRGAEVMVKYKLFQ